MAWHAEGRKAQTSWGEVYIRVEKMMGCKAERPTSNPFVTLKVGLILKLLTNDIQGGKIQSGKEESNGCERVIWEISVKMLRNNFFEFGEMLFPCVG